MKNNQSIYMFIYLLFPAGTLQMPLRGTELSNAFPKYIPDTSNHF